LPWSSTARIAMKRLARAGIENVTLLPAALGAPAPPIHFAPPKLAALIRVLEVTTL
jgi:hypothetical protein